jgi:hypothetical protein
MVRDKDLPFVGEGTSSPPPCASLYHIERGFERRSRRHREQRAAHHWAAAGGCYFNTVRPFYLLCLLPAWYAVRNLIEFLFEKEH